MMGSEDILKALTHFVKQNFMVEEDEIDFDDSLIDQGIIDSFGLVEITAYIQTTYGVTVTEEEMTREQFGSMNKMANYIARKVAEHEAS